MRCRFCQAVDHAPEGQQRFVNAGRFLQLGAMRTRFLNVFRARQIDQIELADLDEFNLLTSVLIDFQLFLYQLNAENRV